jgi:hypothetical protein
VVVGLGGNTVGLLVLVPLHGAVGAAYAGIFSAAVSSAVGVIAMSRLAGVNPLAFVVPRGADWKVVVREVASVLRRRKRARVEPLDAIKKSS